MYLVLPRGTKCRTLGCWVFRRQVLVELHNLASQIFTFGSQASEGSLIVGFGSIVGGDKSNGELVLLSCNILRASVFLRHARRGTMNLLRAIDEFGAEIDELHH